MPRHHAGAGGGRKRLRRQGGRTPRHHLPCATLQGSFHPVSPTRPWPWPDHADLQTCIPLSPCVWRCFPNVPPTPLLSPLAPTPPQGLSGGVIAVYPPRESTFEAEKNIIVGNVVLYGEAAQGGCFFTLPLTYLHSRWLRAGPGRSRQWEPQRLSMCCHGASHTQTHTHVHLHTLVTHPHHPRRRHPGRSLLPGRGRRALLRAQLGRLGRGRGLRRPRL